MAKPKKEAKRSVEKVSRRKGSGVNLYPVGEISIPVASELAEELLAKIGSPDNLPVASELAEELLAKIGSPDNQVTPQQLSLPFYGNYCGRGHGDPTGNKPPIDAVDAVCREHNRCYRLRGAFDSRCDRDLIESMPSAIASTPSPIGKKAGFLALLYFSLAERNLALGETLFKRT